MTYDIIGDIHGQIDKLTALLGRLGYQEHAGRWRPPQNRQAVFLGDLIDRGPGQLEVLRIVRSMIDAGDALCIMGNHEFNAIAYLEPSRTEPGKFPRAHNQKNIAQHAEFLHQVGEGSALHREWVLWFRTLRPALALGGIRVVHAWWHEPFIHRVSEHWPVGKPMSDDFLDEACRQGTPLWNAMEGLTKGHDIRLPDGHSFTDHAGLERHEVRTRWWHENPRTYRDVAIVGREQASCVPDCPLPDDLAFPPLNGAPVFIGHYWMQGKPEPMAKKVACLDWSAAKAGPLVGYRWDGESEIDPTHFVATH